MLKIHVRNKWKAEKLILLIDWEGCWDIVIKWSHYVWISAEITGNKNTLALRLGLFMCDTVNVHIPEQICSYSNYQKPNDRVLPYSCAGSIHLMLNEPLCAVEYIFIFPCHSPFCFNVECVKLPLLNLLNLQTYIQHSTGSQTTAMDGNFNTCTTYCPHNCSVFYT